MGPMFAGKTCALIDRISVEEKKNKSILVVKSAKDTRYSRDEVVSHNGMKRRCTAVNKLEEISEEDFEHSSVIAIDEGQFFDDLAPFCRRAADQGRTVIVAGLDGDFQRQRFGQVLDIVPIADAVIKLSAKCSVCDEEAPFTGRVVDSKEQTFVGGAESYQPLCRDHYLEHSAH
eukprot:CAMPEP_0184487754 /NCGR_PEP_ID=MMETSP0113_2-20130426/10315_1 /TAXON_ID=91329 /ORGANISM="Norrisiella sphaerica, Strain BC52" /LENGTH=173 /DNA_ID=CAMNT_0026870153 /DNA_START=317 /DNA_END=838 /DNA_ORIENTATION=-